MTSFKIRTGTRESLQSCIHINPALTCAKGHTQKSATDFSSVAERAGQSTAACSRRVASSLVCAIKQRMTRWTSTTSLRTQPTLLSTIFIRALTKALRCWKYRPTSAKYSSLGLV